MRKNLEGGLVYSTDLGRTCPGCRQPIAGCTCASTQPAGAPGAGPVRVGRETKGRGGKTVTLVRGLGVDPAALAAIGKELRTALGAGGSARDGVLEVQGDHVERVVAWLEKRGWGVKPR